MKVKKNKNQVRELIVLGALAHDAQVLNSVSIWEAQNQEDLFLSDAHDRIASWCVDHFREKHKPPGFKVLYTHYYEPWEEESGGTEKCEMVATLLNRIEEHWNVAHFQRDQLFDLTEDVLRRQQVLIASDRMGGSSSARNIADVVPGSVAVALTREPEFDNFFKRPDISKNILASTKPIFTFSDEVVTDFYADTFAPATFTQFAAPEKRGKSQHLLECVMSALKCKKKVLFFDAGDMTEDQIFMRYAARAMKRPYLKGPQIIFNELYTDGDKVICESEEKEWEDALTQRDYDNVLRKCLSLFEGRLFTRNFPRGSLSVDTIRSILDSLSIRGIEIDVVVIDYADILRPSKNKYSDNRHAITEIWGDLRTLSSSYEVALITATQTDASTYTNKITQGSFSESKTKYAFITAEVCINKHEEYEGVFELGYTFRRTGSLSRSIFIASDLSTYRPIMKAVWAPKKADGEKRAVAKFRKSK